jgi:hypothetical protein
MDLSEQLRHLAFPFTASLKLDFKFFFQPPLPSLLIFRTATSQIMFIPNPRQQMYEEVTSSHHKFIARNRIQT